MCSLLEAHRNIQKFYNSIFRFILIYMHIWIKSEVCEKAQLDLHQIINWKACHCSLTVLLGRISFNCTSCLWFLCKWLSTSLDGTMPLDFRKTSRCLVALYILPKAVCRVSLRRKNNFVEWTMYLLWISECIAIC